MYQVPSLFAGKLFMHPLALYSCTNRISPPLFFYFLDDWMNEYWQKETKDDYRFTYMGGDGTFTPFHADVYR
jgi:hypothetical protein